MDLYAFPPIAALLDGAHAVLMGLAGLLEPLIGVSSAAAAIVLVTILVRTALIPVGVSQAKAERMRARLAPQLADLRRRHGTDPERLQRETMALYAAEGTSPFAGCLPLLIQAPIVGVIYALFILPTIAGHPNALLEQTFLGVPLGSSLAGSLASGTLAPGELVVFGVVIGLDRVGRRGHPPRLPGADSEPGGCRGRIAPPTAGRAAAPRVAAVPHRGDRGLRAARRRPLPARHRGVDARATDRAAAVVPTGGGAQSAARVTVTLRRRRARRSGGASAAVR